VYFLNSYGGEQMVTGSDKIFAVTMAGLVSFFALSVVGNAISYLL